MPVRFLKQFMALESASAILLFIMALLGMIWANSPLEPWYQAFMQACSFWINDGLMAIFFLVVGLELKRGYVDGHISSGSKLALPLMAALGGMLVPALIYIGINYGNAETIKGWSTPVATDIAFAIGVLSLFGKRIPITLKLFLLSLAIFDDLGAMIIIAFFLAHGLWYPPLGLACLFIGFLSILNRLSVAFLLPYLLAGAGLWLCFLYGGIHPTLAGVVLALFIPVRNSKGGLILQRLETALHPWVAYCIMPLFALANTGFPVGAMAPGILTDPVVIGIALGLFIGKQAGVFGSAWLFIRLRFAQLPDQTSWLMLYGVALLCGIGFTMSLFLGTLSFQNEQMYLAKVRFGVILGSVLSILTGVMVLGMAFALKNKRHDRSSIID